MTTPAPTNPDAQFPAHDPTASFSFPKEEGKTLEYALLAFRATTALTLTCLTRAQVLEGD